MEKPKAQQIAQRKLELIKRDPLTKKWNSLKMESDKYPSESKTRSDIDHRLEDLGKKISTKWNVHLMQDLNRSSEPLSGLKVSIPVHANVTDMSEYIEQELIPQIKLSMEFEANKEHFGRVEHVFLPTLGGYEKGNYGTDKYYIPSPVGSVPLLIDLVGLSMKSKTKVLKEIWDVLEKKIRQRKNKYHFPIPQIGDSAELGFICNTSQDVFDNYLRCYDLHMGENLEIPKGWGFRQIAVLEVVKKRYPNKLEEAKKKISKKTKTIKTKQGERILKGVIGEPIQGEDNVEMGVKLIFKAIHRKIYPSKKKQELFNCPVHDKLCPQSCKHLKESKRIFNNRFKQKRLDTTDEIELVADPEGIQPPAQGEASKIMGKIKKQNK